MGALSLHTRDWAPKGFVHRTGQAAALSDLMKFWYGLWTGHRSADLGCHGWHVRGHVDHG